MKEQDAAHSFETSSDAKFNLLKQSLSALYMQVDAIVAEDLGNNILPYVIELRTELTSLRSELQQKNEETTALKMKSEAQLQSYLYTTDTLTKKLKQERELRKELTWVAEFGYSVMSVNHPRLSEVKSIIEKAKLNN